MRFVFVLQYHSFCFDSAFFIIQQIPKPSFFLSLPFVLLSYKWLRLLKKGNHIQPNHFWFG